MQVGQMAAQALQSQDCNAAMQACDGIVQFIQMMPYLIIVIAYTVFCAMVEHNKKKKQLRAAAEKQGA